LKLPRELSAGDLVKAVALFGYEVSHQTGSHIRLTTTRDGEHHITIPAHDPIRVGTLNSILRDLCNHHHVERGDLLRELFG
jgi:predicted RNA binding protein YcfA (HicA-like mRNA interferase family)